MAGAPVRRASYKDTLQPALHRRFSSTAILLLAVSYVEALLLADWSSYFWAWLPFGLTGFRALLIFACGLSILILRIAHYHVGLKTTESGLQTLGSSLLNLSTYETGFWYGISSLLFCPIFLFSMSESANLSWVTHSSGDRPRLNERPLFLACYLGVCALLQTINHYRVDIDRLDFGVSRRSSIAQSKGLSFLPLPFQTVLLKLPTVLGQCARQALSAALVCLILYYAVFRSFAWSWALLFLRPFNELPKTAALPSFFPTDLFLLVRCLYAGTLMNFVWSSGNTAFSVFMVKEPLKHGIPLTSEAKDPNGSLVNGLKSKKLSIQSFALWELSLIAQYSEARRQAIYCDIDRKDGSTWSQIYNTCMDLLKQIENRVDEYRNPPPAVAAAQSAQLIQQKHRVSAPLRRDAVLNPTEQSTGLLSGVERALDHIARAPGATPVSDLSPFAKKTWRGTKDRILSKEQQEALSPEHLRSEIENWTTTLMKIGFISSLFCHDYRTRLAAVVMGKPHAEAELYIHAAQALCHLAVHSLAEDQFGNVHRDVPTIIRTLTSVIQKVEDLKQTFPVHWTDPSGCRDSPEVDQVLDALRSGLEQIIAKFEPFRHDLHLSLGDMRMAKEALVKPKQEEPIVEKKEAMPKSRAVEAKKPQLSRMQHRGSRRPEMEQVR
ncbi:hypothetical protein E4U60_002877 [Claviceps pazoutovae]|uniref:Nuclear envelope protein n=1 Tax=Claviceps pazoutovae TaxID=1649127 RepID=A0A9P7MAL2_9HYPO|nr:hypothetical protein E4U60_002877 [Claviceps pazoutovae]